MRTPEEIKMYMKEYYLKNKDRLKNNSKEYYENNKKVIREKSKQYRDNNKDIINSKKKQWYIDNKERILEKRKEYYENNKEVIKERKKESIKDKASRMLSAYRRKDKEYGREFNLTQKFILERIFNSSCVYCGETDWHKLGCDRIDNTKGHTTDNVVCSCWDCNNKRNTTPFQEFLLSQNPSSASDILSSLGLLQ